MKRGFWHQCGDKSQKMVFEQLQNGNGVGVILSPRDLSFENAAEYSLSYKGMGADVLIDLQFYNPTFSNNLLSTYPIDTFRQSMTSLRKLNSSELRQFANDLRVINGNLSASAIIAPAMVYEAGRNDIIELNSSLFSISKSVGDDLGIPTYSTIMLGKSITISDTTIMDVLSSATGLNSDGIYFGFEFDVKRIPFIKDEIKRFGKSTLNLACTGKPVLHSFVGPLSLLSLAFGATGAAVGHSQNLWQFSRGRWEQPTGQGGGGDAPARYFSSKLWGTFVYPDELLDTRLTTHLRNRLLTPTPFSSFLDANTSYSWDRWTANKHLLFSIGSTIRELCNLGSPLDCAIEVLSILEDAVKLGSDISSTGLILKDNTCCYQSNWLQAVSEIISNNSDDYDYLSLLTN